MPLAILRRLYTSAQLEYVPDAVIEVACYLCDRRLPHRPSASVLRHFTAEFEPLETSVRA